MEYVEQYDENKAKFQQLQPQCRWAAQAWMDHCWSEGHYFLVTEVFRSQEEQNDLILIGRFTEKDFWDDVKSGRMTSSTARRGIELLKLKGGRPGRRVTWTLDSNHTKRLAADIMPLPGGYPDLKAYAAITSLAALYGITNPIAGDRAHYEFTAAKQPPIPSIPKPEILLQRLTNALKWANASRKVVLTRAIERVRKMLKQG